MLDKFPNILVDFKYSFQICVLQQKNVKQKFSNMFKCVSN